MNKLIILLLFYFILNDKIEKVLLKTCEGCALKNYPEVIDFIKIDSEKYGNKIEIDYKAEGIPRFICRNSEGEDIRVLDISKLNQGQIRNVLEQLNIIPNEPLTQLKKKNKKKPKSDPLVENIAKNIEF